MRYHNKTILLVEDDSITALVEKKILERYGYNVIVASTGEKGVELAAENAIDLVLMDLDLGGVMDGHNAASEILSRKNLPIMFLTAHIEPSMVQRVQSITRYGYALKNSGESVLISSIEMAFDLFDAHEKIRISEKNYRGLVEEVNDIIFSLDKGGAFTYTSPRITDFTGFRQDELTGKHLAELICRDDMIRTEAFFSMLQSGRDYADEFRIMDSGGKMLWARISARPVLSDGIFSGTRGVMINITEQKESEKKVMQLLDEKEQLLKQLNCLYTISHIAEESSKSLPKILSEIITFIPGAFSNPEHTAVMIEYCQKTYTTYNYRNCAGGIAGCAPIAGKKPGSITIRRKTRHNTPAPLGEQEQLTLKIIAERIERIIELYIARDELRKLEKELITATETERQNIGHELHDSLGQQLTGLSFMLRTLKKRFGNSAPGIDEYIDDLININNESVITCRKITRGLPLVTIGHSTLLLALDQLTANTREVYSKNCVLVINGELQIKDDFIASQLFRITQEAVINSVKHSDSDNIYISINRTSPAITLTVSDDGTYKEKDTASDGFGLNIMKYRSDLINASFSAGVNKDGGFSVSVSLPLSTYAG